MKGYCYAYLASDKKDLHSTSVATTESGDEALAWVKGRKFRVLPQQKEMN